jgi:hypothetical protein
MARILAIPAQSVRPPDTRSIGVPMALESENGGGFNWAGISLRECDWPRFLPLLRTPSSSTVSSSHSFVGFFLGQIGLVPIHYPMVRSTEKNN